MHVKYCYERDVFGGGLTLQFLGHGLGYTDFQQELVGGGVVEQELGALLGGHPYPLT